MKSCCHRLVRMSRGGFARSPTSRHKRRGCGSIRPSGLPCGGTGRGVRVRSMSPATRHVRPYNSNSVPCCGAWSMVRAVSYLRPFGYSSVTANTMPGVLRGEARRYSARRSSLGLRRTCAAAPGTCKASRSSPNEATRDAHQTKTGATVENTANDPAVIVSLPEKRTLLRGTLCARRGGGCAAPSAAPAESPPPMRGEEGDGRC